jgi:hypothetical protein
MKKAHCWKKFFDDDDDDRGHLYIGLIAATAVLEIP